MGAVFQSLDREHGFEPLELRGTLPADLRGTLYKNGPAIFEAQGTPYRHWLDGDGAICAVQICDGVAQGAIRVTQTKELVEERAAKKMLYGSGFTMGPVWHKRLFGQAKNPSNIHVLCWQGRLFAMTEMANPYELDPSTLQTLGPCDFGGIVKQGLNAHVRVHPHSNTIYAFGPHMGMRSGLEVFALPTTGSATHLSSVHLDSMPILIHDLAMSDKHLIFTKPPVHVKVAPMMLGTKSAMDVISFHPEEGSEIIVVPLTAADGHGKQQEPIVIKTPAFMALHSANAFELGPDHIAVDLCKYPEFDLGDAFMLDALRSGQAWLRAPAAKLERLHIDLRKREARFELLWDANCDFPTTAPSKQGFAARYLWAMVTREYVDRICKYDHDSKQVCESNFSPWEYPSEPTLVPRPGATREDDGWILTSVYDGKEDRTFIAVLDAANPAIEYARAYFSHRLPFPLHGAWDQQVYR